MAKKEITTTAPEITANLENGNITIHASINLAILFISLLTKLYIIIVFVTQ
jgi:hypothetical protein